MQRTQARSEVGLVSDGLFELATENERSERSKQILGFVF